MTEKSLYKYKQQVTIMMESNSILDMRRIANKYFNPAVPHEENDNNNMATYVAISAKKDNYKEIEETKEE